MQLKQADILSNKTKHFDRIRLDFALSHITGCAAGFAVFKHQSKTWGEEKGMRVHLTSNINPIKMKITKLKTMSAWF